MPGGDVTTHSIWGYLVAQLGFRIQVGADWLWSRMGLDSESRLELSVAKKWIRKILACTNNFWLDYGIRSDNWSIPSFWSSVDSSLDYYVILSFQILRFRMPAVSTIRKHCRDWILTDILYCRICEKAARGWKLKFLINKDVEVDELSEQRLLVSRTVTE